MGRGRATWRFLGGVMDGDVERTADGQAGGQVNGRNQATPCEEEKRLSRSGASPGQARWRSTRAGIVWRGRSGPEGCGHRV